MLPIQEGVATSERAEYKTGVSAGVTSMRIGATSARFALTVAAREGFTGPLAKARRQFCLPYTLVGLS